MAERNSRFSHINSHRFASERIRRKVNALIYCNGRAETALNDKNMVIASTQEKIKSLNAKLIAIPAETIRLTTAIEEEANTRHHHELNQQRAHFDNQIKKLEGVVVRRDMLLKDLEI